MNYWLIKQEPEEYSWYDLEKQGSVIWDGVRNYQARNNLKAMEYGDLALFYHSVTEKKVVGIAEVTQTAFPDHTSQDEDRWVSVVFKPVKRLKRPVSLSEIKSKAELSQTALIRQSRLSVISLKKIEFDIIILMSEED